MPRDGGQGPIGMVWSSIGKTDREAPHAHQGGIDGQGHHKEDDAKSERKGDVALRRLERDGRGHGPRHVVDIAADDHDGAHLGDGAAEACQHGGDQAVAAVPKQRGHDGARRGAERTELLVIFLEQVLAGLAGQRADDRE